MMQTAVPAHRPAYRPAIVVMGVSGCGKSSAGRAIAAALGLPMIEGDDFHPAANKALMAAGTPLTDANRAEWLATLGAELIRYPDGAVLSCSALKRRYRDQLRAASPGLRFVYLAITPEAAQERVRARATEHFFPPQLVASQFAALESPEGEAGVMSVDATLAPEAIRQAALNWLNQNNGDKT